VMTPEYRVTFFSALTGWKHQVDLFADQEGAGACPPTGQRWSHLALESHLASAALRPLPHALPPASASLAFRPSPAVNHPNAMPKVKPSLEVVRRAAAYHAPAPAHAPALRRVPSYACGVSTWAGLPVTAAVLLQMKSASRSSL
jgi:hypothetical protein